MDIAILKENLPMMDWLIEKGFHIDNVDPNGGMSAVHLASRSGPLEVLGRVLSYNPDLTLKSKEGQSVIHFCTECEDEMECIRMLEVLISKGLPLDEVDVYGHTPLMNALMRDSLSVVKLLIQAGASLKSAPKAESILNSAPEGSETWHYLQGVLTARREKEELAQTLGETQSVSVRLGSAKKETEAVKRSPKSI